MTTNRESPESVLAGKTALLLDLDGTLYDAKQYSSYLKAQDLATGLRLLEIYNTPDPQTAFDALVADQKKHGFPSKSATLQSRFGIGLSEMNRVREREVQAADHLEPNPKLRESLERLVGSFMLVLGTNSAPRLTFEALEVLEVPDALFSAIWTSEDFGVAKPDSQFFKEVVRRCGIAPERWVSIGDRQASDLDPAKNLGMGTWLVKSMPDLYRLAGCEETPS